MPILLGDINLSQIDQYQYLSGLNQQDLSVQ